MSVNKFLITGSSGQIGKGLIPQIIKKFGKENVLVTDIKDKNDITDCNYMQLDVRDKERYEHLIKSEKINYIVHLAGILSVLAEKNPKLAKEVNFDSVFTTLDLSVKYNTKLFIPSTILTFVGDKPSVPKVNLNDIPEPRIFYGIGKVFMENLAAYYVNKYNLDFRCIRYPVVVSPFEYEYNGTAYYATQIFFEAVRNKYYEMPLSANRKLPFAHLNDLVDGTLKILSADKEKLKKRVYFMQGLSFSPEEISNEIKKHIPEFTFTYKPTLADNIASKCPFSVDDLDSRRDFGFDPKYQSLDHLVRDMIEIAKVTKKI